MKCLNCGARVKKSEEICPECGAYISDERDSSVPETNLKELEKAEEAVRNIDEGTPEKYDYKDYLLLPSILRIGGGIALFIVCILSFDSKKYFFRTSSLYSLILCFFISAFLVFNGIVSIIQERKCFLNITSDKVYGRIPLGIFETETIDINIEDIISVNETGFNSRYPNPEVHIVMKENEITVKGSSGKLLKNFSKTLQNKMIILKGESE